MVDHSNIPTIHVFKNDVNLVKTGTKRNDLLVKGNTVQLLLEQRIRNPLLDAVLDGTVRSGPAVDVGHFDQDVTRKAVDAILVLPGQILIAEKNRNRSENS